VIFGSAAIVSLQIRRFPSPSHEGFGFIGKSLLLDISKKIAACQLKLSVIMILHNRRVDKTPVITKEQQEKIEELRAKGNSQAKIAEELIISRATVARRSGGEKKLTIGDLFGSLCVQAVEQYFPNPSSCRHSHVYIVGPNLKGVTFSSHQGTKKMRVLTVKEINGALRFDYDDIVVLVKTCKRETSSRYNQIIQTGGSERRAE
jgi:hypothetical protein